MFYRVFDNLNLIYLKSQITIISCEYSAEECRSLGFNKVNLLCSSCNYLSEFELDHVLG